MKTKSLILITLLALILIAIAAPAGMGSLAQRPADVTPMVQTIQPVDAQLTIIRLPIGGGCGDPNGQYACPQVAWNS